MILQPEGIEEINYLDFIAPVDYQEREETLRDIRMIEHELDQDC